LCAAGSNVKSNPPPPTKNPHTPPKSSHSDSLSFSPSFVRRVSTLIFLSSFTFFFSVLKILQFFPTDSAFDPEWSRFLRDFLEMPFRSFSACYASLGDFSLQVFCKCSRNHHLSFLSARISPPLYWYLLVLKLLAREFFSI